MTSDTTTLMERLKALEGTRAAEPLVGPDEVNEAMIRHWCEALGDENPVYTDREFAAASVHGGIVAPPAMLQAWTMIPRAGGPGSPNKAVMGVLDDAGFTSVIATDCEQEYARYLRPGDRITSTTYIDTISEEKATALGPGHFVTTRVEYTDQAGDVVGTQRFRLLKFRPKRPSAPPVPAEGSRPDGRPRPAMNDDSAFFWEGARAGELRIQRCAACGVLRHPPRPGCGSCGSLDWDWAVASGRGTVYSFAVHHYPPVPGFDPPFLVALIELEEGTRLISNVIDVEPADARIGMPVRVEFVAVDEELTLPLFRASEEA
jgi:uncharacterized OB-fold protein/acyl dehydratase